MTTQASPVGARTQGEPPRASPIAGKLPLLAGAALALAVLGGNFKRRAL